jgi:hypothetical protein
MIRLAYLVILTLPLCAFQCRGPQVETVMATVFGEEAARNSAPAAFLTIPDEPEVVALVTEPEVIVPPPPVYERVCWIEWHRAGTMAVEVCEDRLVTP